MTRYEFTNHGEILKAIDALPDDKPEYNTQLAEIKKAAKSFLDTRSNSELLDMKDLQPSFWDYEQFIEWFEEEEGTRSWPTLDETRESLHKLQESVLEEWSKKDSLEAQVKALQTQVGGMQKKLDKVIKLLEGTKVTMSVEDALKL